MNRLLFFTAGATILAAGLFVLADDEIDLARLRLIHKKAQSGQTLTPEEQTYYARGMAARKQGVKGVKQAAQSATADAQPSTTGLIPLTDMSAVQMYKGEHGGLYGDGSNTPPAAHRDAAVAASANIRPLDAEGRPSPQGRIVLLTHGMSNTTQESQKFIELANADSRKNPALLIVDGAQGGIDSRQWVSDKPARNGTLPWERLDQRLQAAGATREQVQVVWMKHAIARVGQFGEFPKHAHKLQDDLGQIARLLKSRFPNLQLAYLSSRTYGGYATTELNPEPYAYESAFAVRGVIREQINRAPELSYAAGKSPVLLWGPYLWAAGDRGRKAGDLSYDRADYQGDGTHPSPSGQQKIAQVMLTFFSTDPTTKPWFLK